jgi:hypothetical protein
VIRRTRALLAADIATSHPTLKGAFAAIPDIKLADRARSEAPRQARMLIVETVGHRPRGLDLT